MAKYNDIKMNKWKNYDDLFVDSLWIIDKRDSTGVHNSKYHGNFIPQIPNQLFRRFTKKGDLILDPFAGSGTSLIEAQRLNRDYLGIELQKKVADNAAKLLKEEYKTSVKGNIVVGDSATVNIEQELKKLKKKSIQFVIMHPPYWDIIKFSKNKKDLSNAKTLNSFLAMFEKVCDNVLSYLDKDRYFAVVIGDKYTNSQLVPLGFYCMNLLLNKGYILKSVIVKNFGETKGKNGTQGIWRYRALAADFYVFKHEYILLFKKSSKKKQTI